MLALFLVAGIPWLICSFLSYGFAYAYSQNGFPYETHHEPGDFWFCLWISIFGPFTLLALVFDGDTEYGLRFRRYKYVNGVRQ